jgi:uncharacterized protein (TIGR03382 family)
MKIRNILLAAVCSLAASSFAAHRAAADEVLYDGTGFLRGTQSFAETFNLPSAGTLMVTLSNVAWPAQLASLNLVLSSTNGILGPEMGAGMSAFTVASGGNVTAQWFGTAQGALDTGVYSMRIEFLPSGGTPVPLPPSFALLLSGLAWLLWRRRELRAI